MTLASAEGPYRISVRGARRRAALECDSSDGEEDRNRDT